MRTYSRFIIASLCLAAFMGAPDAYAQIRVRLRSEHSRYLLFEPLVVRVRVDNEGAAPLVLGAEGAPAKLRLDVDLAPDRPAPRTGEATLTEPIEIPPSGFQVVTIDLLRLFDLVESGPIAVTARVEAGGKEYVSSRLLLDIVPGLVFAETDASAPGEGVGVRRYQLRTLGRGGNEYLFLRVDDPERGVCRGVFDLGTLVRVWKPQMMVDGKGLLHVLHQSAPARLTHTIYNDGERRARMEFLSTTRRPPELARGEDGVVTIIGSAPYQGDPILAPRRGDEAPPDRLPDPRRR